MVSLNGSRSGAVAVLLAVAVFATACSGDSSDGARSGSGADPEAPVEVDTSQSSIVFTSKDGSAGPDTRTVFTVTNTDTDKSFLVPVTGAGEDTQTQISVAPGNYRIESDEPHVSATGSSLVRDLEPAELTVDDEAATVEFGLEVQRSPFELKLDLMTDTTVGLTWEAIDGVEVAGYELRRTDGAVAATGPGDGVAVELKEPIATTATVEGLAAQTDYTFTLFATSAEGEDLATRSLTVTTASADGGAPAFALAANTIVPDDFEALAPELVGTGLVEVTLGADNGGRSSATEIPGVETTALDSGCAVGLPVLVSTEVAGDNAFYGLVESCGDQPRSFTGQAPTGTSAVVNTDVPLAAVVPFLHFENTQVNPCFDATGKALGAGDPLCAGTDTDGDGVRDTAEAALGLDPASDADGWAAWEQDEPSAVGGAESETVEVGELELPDGLGTGDVQVTLLWSSGDDLDLFVTEPGGVELSYDNQTSPSGGRLDEDDRGDATCKPITTARAENIFWSSGAPKGEYKVDVVNYSGSGGACGGPAKARLEVKVGGTLVLDRTITVGADGPTSFKVLEKPFSLPSLEPPARYSAGDVSVNVLWTTGDDINLNVTDPAGKPLSLLGTGADLFCQPMPTRAENAYVTSGAPAGTYRVEVGLGASCNRGRAEGWLIVQAKGQLIARKAFVIENFRTEVLTFTLDGPRLGNWSQSTGAGFAAPAAGPPKVVTASPPITCSGTGSSTYDPGFGFGEFHKTAMTLKWGTLAWDIEAGITAYMDPTLKMEGGVECGLDIDGVSFQLTTTPVPINLELAPVLEGSATGSFELNGPRMELTFGLKSQGRVDARMEFCGWWKFKAPCGVEVDAQASASPIGGFEHGAATVKVEGELSLGVGVEATLGVGIKNEFVTAKSGFALKMKPLVGSLSASATLGTSSSGAPVATTTTPTTTTAPRVLPPQRVIPPYSANQVMQLRLAQANSSDEVTYIGPRLGDRQCHDDHQPIPYEATAFDEALQMKVVTLMDLCPDAICLDPGNGGPIYSERDGCAKARCYGNSFQISTGSDHDGRAECPQSAYDVLPSQVKPRIAPSTAAPAPSGSGAPGGGGPQLDLCAEASIGAELAVDFRAEAWVMGWGKDRRYPVWEGEFEYPGAKFEIGDC